MLYQHTHNNWETNFYTFLILKIQDIIMIECIVLQYWSSSTMYITILGGANISLNEIKVNVYQNRWQMFMC